MSSKMESIMIENTSSRGYSANQEERHKPAPPTTKISTEPSAWLVDRQGQKWGQTRTQIDRAARSINKEATGQNPRVPT